MFVFPRFVVAVLFVVIAASPASASLHCSLPGESQPVSDTVVTTEQLLLAESMQPSLRTAYGRDGQPGTPIGPMYSVTTDPVTGLRVLTRLKANWLGPKRAVILIGHSNPRDTFAALVRALVLGVGSVPPVASDIAFYNFGRSKKGAGAWINPTGAAWFKTFKIIKNLKLGPALQVPWVTTYPEVKLAILGLTGGPNTGQHMTAAQALGVADLVHSITPNAQTQFIDMAYLGWARSNLTNESSAHNDYTVMQGIASTRTEGYFLSHYANHAHERNCQTDYSLKDGIHASPAGYAAMAAEWAHALYTNPAYRWMWEPAVLP